MTNGELTERVGGLDDCAVAQAVPRFEISVCDRKRRPQRELNVDDVHMFFGVSLSLHGFEPELGWGSCRPNPSGRGTGS